MDNKTKSIGPIIGTFIVIVVLIIAAIYVLASHANKQSIENSATITNTADDVQSLKNDLNQSIR